MASPATETSSAALRASTLTLSRVCLMASPVSAVRSMSELSWRTSWDADLADWLACPAAALMSFLSRNMYSTVFDRVLR